MQYDFDRLIFTEKPVDLLNCRKFYKNALFLPIFVLFFLHFHNFLIGYLKFCRTIWFVSPMYDNFATNEGGFVGIFLFLTENCLRFLRF